MRITHIRIEYEDLQGSFPSSVQVGQNTDQEINESAHFLHIKNEQEID